MNSFVERAIASINLEIAPDDEEADNSVLTLNFPSFVSPIGDTHYL
jgi:hypothetical protein